MKNESIYEIIRSVLVITICSASMFNCSENRNLTNENKELKANIDLAKEALSKSDKLISIYSIANDSLERIVRKKHLYVVFTKDGTYGKGQININ